MNRNTESKEAARRGLARAEREKETLRARRYAQRLEREGRAPAPEPASHAPAVPVYELEFVPGLEPFVRDELRRLLRGRPVARPGAADGALSLEYRGEARLLLSLATATSVSRVLRFAVPRPRALLGEEHLQTLLRTIESIRTLQPEQPFRSFRFSAAGVTSSVFHRLAGVLTERMGLIRDPEEGDLLIRVRRASASGRPSPNDASGNSAFEVLVRLTPRPLSARPWRVCNLPGALNATVARAMVEMTQPQAHDRFVNLTCGSGTLMIERLAAGPAHLVLGGDRDPAALRCAAANLDAAGDAWRAVLARWDAGRLPLRDASVNVLCADLPYGMLMGSRRENAQLYPALLAEATRVAVPGASLALITQAVALLDATLAGHRAHWTTERRFPVQISFKSGTLSPHVVLLRRTGRR
jgi:tRNA (guanine6-N2)-methyltransferase